MQNINKLPRVAITHGDTNGIGYELILKAFSEPEILEIMTPIIYGSRMIAAVHAEQVQAECKLTPISSAADAIENRVNVIDISKDSAPVKFGTPTVESSSMASMALAKALQDYNEGKFDVLVLGPAVDDEIHAIMEKLKELPDVQSNDIKPMNIIGNDTLCVASVAGNVTDKKAATMISAEDVTERATTLRNALRRDMRIDNPRIAVLSVGDTIDESENSIDKTIIAPTVAALREAGMPCFGPFTTKEMFDDGKFVHFDGVLGMYHSQVVTPFNSLFGERSMRFIAGLPVIITAPVQEPSFQIAGKGMADETSIRLAIYAAIDACRSRHYYDMPLKNPLGKIYHERREDGEKARFAVKREFKPRENGFKPRENSEEEK